MRKHTVNGTAHAVVIPIADAQRPSETADAFAAAATGREPAGPDQMRLNEKELRRALAMSQQALSAARRHADALQEQDSILTRRVIQLEGALVQALQSGYHDELTGLPNRGLLLDRFNQAVARAARQHKQVALLFLDLDGFKGINDTFGHAAGDCLLQQVAARLAANIRSSDTACRYGGDEFVVLLPELDGQESAVVAADKIRAHLATPYVVDGIAITVTASIGMSVYPADGKEYDNLIRMSDVAMYRSKVRGLAPPSVLVPDSVTRLRHDGTGAANGSSDANQPAAAEFLREEVRLCTGRSFEQPGCIAQRDDTQTHTINVVPG
jgi:diguanylate cyclase (GGDEF)-like protein